MTMISPIVVAGLGRLPWTASMRTATAGARNGVPITGTVISGNWLSDAHFGIWTQNAHASLSGNHFDDVVVHVHQG
jgi:nitrous oxidase accessory protein NosD